LFSRAEEPRLVMHSLEDLIACGRWFKSVDPAVEP
jgi:hypothetical protein